MRGIFITFEGGEGVGKTTQIKALQKRLIRDGRKVTTIREPGGTVAGDNIRKILLDPATGALDPVTELLLFSAARRELITTVIEPALSDGKIVICDRFYDSTMAYQGYGRGIDKALIKELTDQVCGDTKPDRTILLDVPPEVGVTRAIKREESKVSKETRFELEGRSFHERVRHGFLDIAENDRSRVKVIDASGHVERVADQVYDAITGLL